MLKYKKMPKGVFVVRENEQFLDNLENYFGNWFETSEAPQMTKKLYPYTNMFSPIRVNKLTIKNRLVMGPMGNISMCEETGRPNDKMIAYFEERAKGGVGLITTGLIPVSHGVDPTVTELDKLSYFPRIDRSRTVLAGWRDLAYACHTHGATLFAQLTAGLGRVGNPQCLINSLKLPVSASWNPNFYISAIPCAKISNGKIRKIIKNMGQAAADAKACNIDGVYLHGHEGYLMEQLTNPAFNRRKLGRYSNWQAFGIDCVKKIRERVGNNYPIMYRIDLSLALNATYGDKMKKIKPLKKFRNERRITETLDYMANLVKAGVDIFDVDLGCYDNWWLPHPPAGMPSGCFLEVSKLVKDYFKENKIVSNVGVEVPVVAVGKLGYPDLAEQALRDEKCDMIMLARPLLADPQFPNKAYAGDVENIRPCIGCHEACIKEFVDGGHPQCAINPRCAFEHQLPHDIVKVEKPKKVAVVGAGPAGITATEVLLRRGHKVDLFEREKEVGGMLKVGGKPKIKYEIENYRQYLIRRVDSFKDNKNFELHLGKEVTIKDLKGYDVIMCANGTRMEKFPVEGIENKNVATVVDFLKNPKIIGDAENIAIIGGGDSGCETAYYLSYELGKKVSIIELGKYLMAESCTANRGHIIHYLDRAGVDVHNCTSLMSVGTDGTITIRKNISKTVPNPYNTWQPILPENIHNPLEKKVKEKMEELKIKCDFVLLACGTKPNNELYYELVKENVAKEIYNIGDSNKPGKIFTATKSAYFKAMSI